MLRVETKDNIIRILKHVMVMCEKGVSKNDSTLLSLLKEGQEAIIAVAECLEKDGGNVPNLLSLMESLCETFCLLSENLQNRLIYAEQINKSLAQIVSLMSEIESGYQIVFFPYKADMWDSLESVWLACKDDSRCDCKVVPIPYYHFDANKNEWVYSYEIDRFPEYVPVIDYRDYDLTEGADVAFIHNPYDQYNHVTNVHSDYFSFNLKKYVKNLFYIPYYVTTGFIAEDHKCLSAYVNADYLVVQSESFKEGLKEYSYYDKALVMGSPKLDRIIQLSKEKDIVPKEWKNRLDGKKSLMLNTSLGQFLHDGEVYLQKLKYVFEIVKNYEDVVIIWRPHPLLESTIESMRPHLMKMYMDLKDYFVNENIGIFDTTPDIINTIAVTDGYIGETSSSVVNLFEAAGKPLFILNSYILDNFTKEEKEQLFLMDCEKTMEGMYCNSWECSAIFEVKNCDWENIQRRTWIDGVSKWWVSTGKSVYVNDSIFFTPIWSEEFYIYHTKENKAEMISAINDKKILNYSFVTSYKNKIFYLPNATKCIVEYDVTLSRWTEYREPIKALQEGVNEQIYEDVCGYFVIQNFIWMTTLYSNRVLRFDMKTGKYRIYEVGDTSSRYSAIAVIDDTLYLADAITGNIFVWNVVANKDIGMYMMPNSYKTFQNIQGRQFAHRRLWIVGNSIVSMPGTSNGVVKIDLESGKSEMLGEAFWSDVFEPANNYNYEAHGAVWFAKMMDENILLVQKRRDASLLEINVHTGEYKIRHPRLALNELEKLLEGEDGFEKIYTNGEFARRESKYFSFEGFLDDLINDRFGDAMARQKEAMQTMAVNLDGSCGEKVHEFMMQVLTQK